MDWSEAIWSISTLWIVFLGFAISEFIMMLVLKNKKDVDGRMGKITGWSVERSDLNSTRETLKICVECYINGIYYKENASNSSLRKQIVTKSWFNSKVGTEVRVKYDIDKDGKVTLYIYDLEETMTEAVIFLILAIISLSVFFRNYQV